MDPVSKSLLDAWGVPGLLLAIVGAFAVWLLKRLLDTQDQRVKEASEWGQKYSDRLIEMTNASRQLIDVVNAALSRLK